MNKIRAWSALLGTMLLSGLFISSDFFTNLIWMVSAYTCRYWHCPNWYYAFAVIEWAAATAFIARMLWLACGFFPGLSKRLGAKRQP